MPPCRVLIADDSPTARRGMIEVLNSDPGIQVVGEAANGAETQKKVRALKPDLVTLDLFLGQDDGIATASDIMAANPVAILMITGADISREELAVRALAVGALDAVRKPVVDGSPASRREGRRLCRIIRALAKVPLVTRRGISDRIHGEPASSRVPLPHGVPRVVVLGASTGGPPLVAKILAGIAAPAPWPVIVVQHIAGGFALGLAAWLRDATGHPVAVVDGPFLPRAGQVYVAPDSAHLCWRRSSEWLAPSLTSRSSRIIPSIDELLLSCPESIASNTVAVLLTGMGTDGAEGLRAVRRAGGYTIAQQPSTCTVDGMPNAAIALGAASAVLDPAGIIGLLKP